jgi:hypothetical protein
VHGNRIEMKTGQQERRPTGGKEKLETEIRKSNRDSGYKNELDPRPDLTGKEDRHGTGLPDGKNETLRTEQNESSTTTKIRQFSP